jgi:hypothetical protein
MVQTRHGSKIDAGSGPDKPTGKGKENEPPAGSPPQQRNSASQTSASKKRKLGDKTDVSSPSKRQASGSKPSPNKASSATKSNEEQRPKQSSESEKPDSFSRKGPMSKANITPTSGDTTPKTRDSAEGMETYNDDSKSEKPPLTVEDLRFDYDRSQLRDSRAMPGREARPYYGKLDDMPVALLEHLKETRSVYKSERPKGRLTNAITDDMFVVEARHNPWEMFYHLYQCYDKGREGSPTCDSAGFQRDYDQVCAWMQPQAYNKSAMVNDMNRRVNAAQKEEEEIFAIFFEEGGGPTEDEGDYVFLKDYVKDQVSKDIGVPKHQISVDQVKMWKDKGFKPVKYKDWWREPNEEEKLRMNKMTSGSGMRKEL